MPLCHILNIQFFVVLFSIPFSPIYMCECVCVVVAFLLDVLLHLINYSLYNYTMYSKLPCYRWATLPFVPYSVVVSVSMYHSFRCVSLWVWMNEWVSLFVCLFFFVLFLLSFSMPYADFESEMPALWSFFCCSFSILQLLSRSRVLLFHHVVLVVCVYSSYAVCVFIYISLCVCAFVAFLFRCILSTADQLLIKIWWQAYVWWRRTNKQNKRTNEWMTKRWHNETNE